MSTLLSPHLQQISAASASLSSLPFAPPKIFTNALLRSTDIVSLIRDTDAHERALFTVPTAPAEKDLKKSRMSIAPRRNTAVYSALGGDMVEKLRRGGAGGFGGGVGGVATGEVDVEVLLMGAERLLGVYHIPGAEERIHRARERYDHLTESLENYEALVEAQRQQLDLLQGPEPEEMEVDVEEEEVRKEVTGEMLAAEEEEIRELEERKAELEERIRNVDRRMYRR
ncbi:DASH complex, subunit Spc34 [Choiromyces venosus 120613-1]|uniref:DASH complex subunit SPC34 n=1 Tax=Choiromyces venosus 120613-1 TaxID=1336337 RepID=A0A3N4JEE6_9PEZI|nr:DASH complex, subunit Spc34 [Choiromyces venosus 120613-1]